MTYIIITINLTYSVYSTRHYANEFIIDLNRYYSIHGDYPSDEIFKDNIHQINQKILLLLYLYDPESDHPGPILLYKDPLWVFPNHNYDFTAKTWWVDD